MNKTLGLALIGAAVSVGACHHSTLSTAEQERAQVRESGSETAQYGRETGRNAGEAARDVGSGVSHGVQAAGHGAAAGAQYVAHGVSSNDTEHLQRAQDQTGRMNAQGETSGERFRESGRATVGATRGAGRTVSHAGATGVHATQHAVGTARRATGERPHGNQTARGGGPSAAPQDNADQPAVHVTRPHVTNK